MITKRKCQNGIPFNKDKLKSTKDPKDHKLTKENKKTKKQSTSKLKPSLSKKNIKVIMPKQSYQQSDHQDQNENRSNLPCLYIPTTLRSKEAEQLHYERDHITLRKSASAGGIKLMKQIRKSLSPGLSKQKEKQKLDFKQKYSSKGTSRSQKEKVEKIKQNSSEVQKGRQGGKKLQVGEKLTRKKSEKIIKPQSQRMRTENSSKVAELKQERKQEKVDKNCLKRKMQKMVKPKMCKNGGSKSKSKIMKSKDKKKKSIVFSDVSFHEFSPLYSAIPPKESFYLKIDKKQQVEDSQIIRACIMIQKHFRGYLTRKYIQQSKYMIYCIIKIQKVWRGYWARKKLRKQVQGKRNLSIQNSLITIKDFSEDPKQEKARNKYFKFNFENEIYGRQKIVEEESRQIKSQNLQEQEYLKILHALLLQDGLQEKIKQKIRSTLGKEKYVKNKIISQIVSQKSFNSPREVITSPKASIMLNSPSSWMKNKPQLEICSSPRNNLINQTLSKRLCSPVHKSSSKKVNTEKKFQEKNEIVSLETSFEFIQQFLLKIVDYFKENEEQKQMFLDICKKCEKFRTLLILSEWNMQKKSSKTFLNSLRMEIVPDIFSNYFRNQFLSESEVKIYLEANNYQESLWIYNQTQADIYSAYIKLIFDGFAEAIYENYKSEIITKGAKGKICSLDGQTLFRVVLTNSLTYIQGCSYYMCGAQIPVDEQEQNYKIYQQKNNQRIELLAVNDLSIDDSIECNGIILCSQLDMSQRIFEDLIREVLQFLI